MELRPRQDAAAAVPWVDPTGDDPPPPILFTGSEPDEEMIAALRAAPAIAGPLGCAGKEPRTTYFKRARECTDADLNQVKIYEYEAGS